MNRNAMKRRITAMLVLAMMSICVPGYAETEKASVYAVREASPGEAAPEIPEVPQTPESGGSNPEDESGDGFREEENIFEGADVRPYNASSDTAADGGISGSAKFSGSKKLVAKLYDADDVYLDEAILSSSGDDFSFDGLSAGMYMIRFYFYGEGSLPEKGRVRVEIGYDAPPAPVEEDVLKSAQVYAQNASGKDAADGLIYGSAEFTGTHSLYARLYRSEAPQSQIAYAELTNSWDSFSFSGLKPGNYTVKFAFAGSSATADTRHVAVSFDERIAPIVIGGVTAGENTLTVSGTAQPGAQVMITTQPAAAATAYAMADAGGSFSAAISCAAGVYTRVTVCYSGDTSSAVSMSGNFVVTAPDVRPDITIDPINASSMTVAARTGAGVLVELRTSDYVQRLSADDQGLVQFSLPHTYPKGTKITFTVFYGVNNSQSFETVVTVGESTYLGRLKKGSKGEAVRILTTRLHELGYPVKPTTTFDSTVERAVKLFQEANGLSVTGEAGQGTQGKLFSVSAIPYGQTRYPTFVRGDRDHPLIFALQQRLKELGYYTIKVDGIFGSGTQRAVRDFQRMNGLTVTGKADNATQKLLHSDAAQPAYGGGTGEYRTLRRSSKYQSAVVPMQRRLKALGYYSGSIDGYFGSGTYRAVRNFQQRNGIEKTGVADPYTQKVLYSPDAQPASGSSSPSSPSGYRLLYWGCEGSDVKRLQNALIGAGYRSLVRTADGIYGQWTYDAVCAYQKDHGLTVDGIAGRNTQNALYGTNY